MDPLKKVPRLDGHLENEHLRHKAGECCGAGRALRANASALGAPLPGLAKEASGRFGPYELLLDSK